MKKSMLILIAGPYRSGTNDDPKLMERNLDRLERCGIEIWRKGHLPVIGEWIALPLMKHAGSTTVGDAAYEALAYPVAERIIQRCDAVLRIEGPSKGADQDVALATKLGLKVYYSQDEIPSTQKDEEEI
jgi:hypothetical protein